MTKKILFLLTFLLTTLGGGNLAWAQTTYVLQKSTYDHSSTSDPNTTWHFSNGLTISNSDGKTWGDSDGYIKLSNGVKYTIAGIPPTQTITSVTFAGFLNGKKEAWTSSDDLYIREFNGASYSHGTPSGNDFNTAYYSGNIGSVSFSELSITSGSFTFTPKGALDFIITITTEDKTIDNVFNGTYPYTWDFTVEDAKWTKSKSQMTSGWNFKDTDDPTDGNYDEARPKEAALNTTYDIDIIKGLHFTTSNDWALCLDWKTHALWMNGTVTIPNLTVGQTITFNSSVIVTGDPAVVSTTDNTFTVKTAGSATFEVYGHIYSISVSKALRTLSFGAPSYTISFGTTESHTATPSPATGANITYSSSDDNVATVNVATGELTTVNSGTCTITATAAETAEYAEATASYTLTVNGSKTPTLKWIATDNGNTYTVADLPYGNSKYYKAAINTTDGSDVTASDIRYGVVEEYEGYLTVGATDGKIQPTRMFADDGVDFKVVQVYAYTPSSGDRNASPRILYNVKIVKGTFSGDLFKQNYLTVNAGCTIAPQNNVQSMRWDDIDEITVVNTTGRTDIAVSGPGTEMVSDYKADTSNKNLYFDTKTKDDVEIVDWFYPVFHGKAVGDVTFTVTLKSKLYGDHSGDFTLHVIPTDEHTGFAWADGTKPKYTIYEGDYMLLPEVTGSTNGNFSYSVGAANQSTHHKYVYSRRWNSGTEKYETIYNNKNFHKGEGFPNFDLTEDAEGNTPVPEVKADGSDVALLFWNTGQGTENDRLLIYGNQAGTVYLKASDPQVDRSLSTIEIEVKSRSAIDTDFENLKNSMTFPYTWDFTSEKFMGPDEDGNGYWVKEDNGTYSLDMQSNINYDYADENKDGVTWSNKTTSTTSPDALTSKLLVSSYSGNSVMRGFAGMKIKLGNSGTGSWYSKRDGIHILPYSDPGAPRLKVTTGTHTLILPTPTGENCPATFKVFVKVKTLADNDATLWVRYADLSNSDPGQTKYYKFKYDEKDPYNSRNVAANTDVIYSITATKGQPLELDLDKVDVYWIAYSTEANNTAKPSVNQTLKYAATSYSYGKALDLAKSEEVNNGLTAYYAKTFTNGEDAASAVTLRQVTLDQKRVRANTGLVLKSNNPLTNYMIADAENQDSYSEPTELSKNYLVAGDGTAVSSTTGSGEGLKTNFALSYAYKKFADDGTTAMTGYQYNRDWSFYKVMPSATVPKGKAYLQVDGNLRVKSDGTIEEVTPAGSRRAADGSDDDRPANKLMLDIVYEDETHGFDATTAINDVKTDTVTVDDDAWYTIQGVRVNTPARGGIYIHNGRKVVIK